MRLKFIGNALPVLVALVATPALANQQVWQFNQSTSPLSSNSYGNSISLNQDGIELKVSGWSDTAGPSSAPPEGLDDAQLIYYGNSLGIRNRDEDSGTPNHSIDSYDPANNPSWGNDFDAALLSYDADVKLEGVDIAWAKENYNTSNVGNYADLSVLAYTGTSAFTGFSSSDTWAGILTKGWSVIGNYSNASAYSYQAITTAIESKYWLVSAFNPVFGNSNWSSRNDGFKLAGARTSTGHTPPPPGVPNPGTAALLLLGLLALKKRSKRSCPQA